MIQQLPQVEIDESLPLKDQVKKLKDIINDMSEKLTFMLSSIDTDNLSQNMLKKVGGGDNNTTQTPTINMGIFLKKSDAEEKYLSISDANLYYLKKLDASSIYVTIDAYSTRVNGIDDSISGLSTSLSSLQDTVTNQGILINSAYEALAGLDRRVQALESRSSSSS